MESWSKHRKERGMDVGFLPFPILYWVRGAKGGLNHLGTIGCDVSCYGEQFFMQVTFSFFFFYF